MDIFDRVYGKFTITQPVLIDLVNSAPLQRLKGINQAGAASFVHPQLNVTRFEHCVGVMHLLDLLGASLEEQIAGLLHDVPHTAFSHVADVLFRNKDESYHELFHEKIIMNSEIPSILNNYGFDIKRQFDEDNFSLLERDLPDLCADRIDYTFRDTVAFLKKSEEVERYVKTLCVHDKEIMFSDVKSAYSFSQNYLLMSQSLWADSLNIASYKILADALKIGLDTGLITEKTLFCQDEEVYNILLNSQNNDILEKLKHLHPNLNVVLDEHDYDFHDRTKIRVIDPKIYSNGIITRVSDHFPDYLEEINKEKERIRKGVYIKII